MFTGYRPVEEFPSKAINDTTRKSMLTVSVWNCFLFFKLSSPASMQPRLCHAFAVQKFSLSWCSHLKPFNFSTLPPPTLRLPVEKLLCRRHVTNACFPHDHHVQKEEKRGIFYGRARTLGYMIVTIWQRRHEWNWLRVLSNFFSIIPTRSVFKKRCKIKLGLKREDHARVQKGIVEFFHLVESRSW